LTQFLLLLQATPFILGNLTSPVNNLRLSQGLSARIIAVSGQKVPYTSPGVKTNHSELNFHFNPDGADVFTLAGGRYVYASNAELEKGGVYGVVFDSKGFVRNYMTLINNTKRNCNGGRTPWNTWVTCEETPGGQCWQVSPFNSRPPNVTLIGGPEGGSFEAFSYDARNTSRPAYFVTEDLPTGMLRRYRPPPNRAMNWASLHDPRGTVDYLEFISSDQFRWTTNSTAARRSQQLNYPNAEGIAVHNGRLAFVSKVRKTMFFLDLDLLTYTKVSTATAPLPGGGQFDAQPDHVIVSSSTSGVLVLTEDGGPTPGLFAYDGSKYLSYFESNFVGDEITGFAFSPDRKFILAAVQSAGLLFQIYRDDGLPFEGRRVLKFKKEIGS
jgi:uncharacterized protein